MLLGLHIRDLALIEHAEIEFADGLNVISGETGGGKSLLVTALKLLHGERATGSLVRHGASELRVDGEFALGDSDRSHEIGKIVADLCGAETEGDLLLVSRVVDAGGRSKVRINDRPATLAALRTLSSWLLEIHGQGESRELMRPEIQAETLDAFGGMVELRARFRRALAAARSARDTSSEASSQASERLTRIEYLRYQLAEMTDVALRPGELAELQQEYRVLAHLDNLRELLDTALAALQDSDDSANDMLGRGQRALAAAAEIDLELQPAVEAVSEAQILIDEAAREAQSAAARLEIDPGRLAHVERRLDELRAALSRFGPGEAEFVANLERVRGELDELEGGAETEEELVAEAARTLKVAAAAARKLVRARRRAAGVFCAAIESELAGLAMERAEFRVAMDDVVDSETLLERATPHGPGPLDFEVCLNPGEPFHSMQKTASGGEMARIVLAVKKCLADQDRVPFLVFDEVDAEIGGRLGLAVGAKLRDVAGHHQVLIVTHLPQVAAFADAHFAVGKAEVAGRTVSTIRRLDAASIERELAAMSVGEAADQEAIDEARRLVAKTRPRQRPQAL